MINTRFLATAFLLLSCSPGYAHVERVWLSHRANDPSKLVVNWMTTEPSESVVRFGRTSKYSDEVRVGNDMAMHHVEISLAETGGVYHYSVSTGTLYNERNASMRTQERGAWHEMFRKDTIAITGFGYYAERAEVDGFTYYNTSLSGKGHQYPDPKSQFLKGENSYILLTVTKNPSKMIVEIKGLDESVLDRKVYSSK